MNQAYLEHSNITVKDPDITAALLCKLFDWKIRWSGAALNGGYTVHVGGEQTYLALYKPKPIHQRVSLQSTHNDVRNLNHLGVAVTDLKETERRVRDAGLRRFSHANCEPGQRFCFNTDDGIEIEVISYQSNLRQASFFELASMQK